MGMINPDEYTALNGVNLALYVRKAVLLQILDPAELGPYYPQSDSSCDSAGR